MSLMGNSYYKEAMNYLKRNSMMRAIASFHKAIEEGHGDAAAKLGYLHEIGRGTDKNLEKAIEFYKKGIYLESAEAKGLLGDLYYRGLAGEEKKDTGISLLKEAAAANDMDAIKKIIRYIGRKQISTTKEELGFYIEHADKMLRQGQLNEIDLIRLIYLENGKMNDEQLYQFGKMFFDLSHFEEAEEIFKGIAKRKAMDKEDAYEKELANKIGYVTAGKRAKFWLSVIENE